MSYLVIIRGPLGVGKSTVARKLAYILKGKHISIDDLLEKYNLDKIDKKEGCILLKNFLQLNEKILPRIKRFLAKGTVVVDGNFYHKEQINNLLRNIQQPHYVFTLTAPLKECIKRDKSRRKSHGTEATKAVYKLVSKVSYGKKILTANKTPKVVVEDIISSMQ